MEPLARPRQTLSKHINNMIDAFELISTQIPRLYHNTIREMIYFHDIGKINPWFQKRVKNKEILNSQELPFSFHIQTSTIFYFLYCFISNKIQFGKSRIMELQKSAIFAIASHHNRTMQDLNELGSFNQGVFDAEILLFILNNINYDEIFCFLKQINKDLNTNLKVVEKSIAKHLDRLKNTTPAKLLKFWKDVIVHKPTSPILCELFSSILFDLDEWDARYYSPETNSHLFNFKESIEEIPQSNSKINVVQTYCDKKYGPSIIKPKDEVIIIVRKLLRNSVERFKFSEMTNFIGKIIQISAPTGSGKTLAILNFALSLRQAFFLKRQYLPKIVYCLPFIALGNQIGDQIREILNLTDETLSSHQLIVHNYLTPIKFKRDNKAEDYITGQDAGWFIKNWHASFIVTTFIQFFNTFYNPLKKNWIRMHQLAGTIIIFDEIQTIPVKYWDLIGKTLLDLVKYSDSSIILSTATQPELINPKITSSKSDLICKYDLADLLLKNEILKKLNRYIIHWHPSIKKLAQLTDFIIKNLESAHSMIVVNTTKLASELHQIISTKLKRLNITSHKIFILSGLVTPFHRKEVIEEIISILNSKLYKKKVLLICTQLIEAGVDVSFNLVIRDLAPLDSIVQVAGRCNRSNEDKKKGVVHVVNLKDKSGKRYAEIVYSNDIVDIVKTKEILDLATKRGNRSINEIELREIFKQYYKSTRDDRLSSIGVEEFNNWKFTQLKKEFKYIEELKNYLQLFIPINAEAFDILEQIKENHKNKGSFPNKFYLYSISVNKNLIPLSWIEDVDTKHLKFFVLKNLKVYSKATGLILP